ncbi:MAG TPA: hypothetical protein VFB24_04015 [Candidatus Binatia bacterium]|jgi:hypothetical protein|nr:hypothetical protein [Candidatus Binatia bacterium]
MRHRRRILWIALAVLLVIGAIAAAVLLRKRAAPDAVRLLPNADAVLYVNLEPVRLLTDLGKKPPKNREAEYEDFVRQTGFEPERDLNRAALAIHYGDTPGNRSSETRYSEIMQGRFDHQRVSDYLKRISRQVERYKDFDIYVIPLEGRTLRVALLGFDTAAASNTEGSDAIHGMVDRYKQAALPFSGPAVVGDYYKRVPLGSVIWTIARIPANSAPQDRSELLLPGSWSSLLPRNSVVVASARPLTDVHLRAQVITPTNNDARIFTERVAAFLTLFKTIDISLDGGGPDPDVKKAFDSFEVRQDQNEAVLTASVPFAFFKKIISEPPVEFGGETTKPPEANVPVAPAKSNSNQ